MSETTTDELETLKNEPTLLDVMKAINDFRRETNEQFEAIRQGIVSNSVSYDRLKAEVILLRADVKELSEEVRQNSIKTLV